MKVFVSQPMRGRSEDAIDRERSMIMDALPSMLGESDILEIPKLSRVVSSSNRPLCCLGMSLQDLSNADVVVFAPGWRDARGCIIEHAACLLYRIPYVEVLNASGGYYVSVDGRSISDVELQEG